MNQDLFKGLSEEQIAKVKACKNNEELLALAKQEDIELTEEQLEAVNGGWCSETTEPCPKCGSTSVRKEHRGRDTSMRTVFICKKCGHEWNAH